MVLVPRSSVTFLCLSLTLLQARADESQSVSLQADKTARLVVGGQFFLDAEHVPPPYSIEAKDEAVFVNGRRLEINLSPDFFDWTDDAYVRDFDGQPGSHNGDHPVRLGPPGWRDGAGARRFARSRFGEPRLREFRKPTAENMADLLRQSLRRDAIVVIFGSENATILDLNSTKATFCEALLANGCSPELERDFVLLAQDPAQADNWAAMLDGFRPSSDLKQWLEQQIVDYSSVEDTNLRQIAAANRLQQAAYPLTLAGMLLGVFALGHTLKWSANHNSATDAVRFLKIGLMLIVAMSALDLTWTILSSQAGQMREINPFAVAVIDSPMKLILFKVIATLGACGILFALRSHPKVQAATWWMCLVCVLMTFRWVIFNSLMA